MRKKDPEDYRTWQQAEDVADRLMEQAELAITRTDNAAQRLRDEAIYAMLRAILLKLPKKYVFSRTNAVKGGKHGGKARAAALTKVQRRTIAQNAARARWAKSRKSS
jgi:hypothetical protein